MVNAQNRSAETIATSQADDNALRALIDAVTLTADLNDARIVGGQMVSLLTLAYPNSPRIDRRTADADVGVSTEIALANTLHTRLTDAHYTATVGNRYERDGAVIDLLAPSLDGRFTAEVIGERAIDLAPGLGLAMVSDPTVIDLGITLLDESHQRISVRVPKVEIAVVLKALATRSRTAAKDLTDLYNLLSIASNYDPDEIGGWKLSNDELNGARLDCARALHELADGAHRNRVLADAEIPREEFVALVREFVARPA
jgi:hypothetical protein